MTPKIQENVLLAPLTSFNVGGPARYFTHVASEYDLKKVLSFAKEKKLKVLVLGGGSNVVISDEGWPGLVIQTGLRGISPRAVGDKILVTVGAGEPWDSTVEQMVLKGWTGIEALSGIPGSTGGAVVQNIGAYGQTIQDAVQSVKALEISSGELRSFSKAACDFKYRDSRFKSTEDGRWVVISVELMLTPGGRASLEGVDARASLAAHFSDRETPPALLEIREQVLDIREGKGMVIMDGRERFASAGSFFKNPVVSAEQMATIRAKALQIDAAKQKRLSPWNWPLSNGQVKLSAAFLIEYTSFLKGYRHGSVGISPRHSLAIINLDGAKAAEIVAMAQAVQAEVHKIFRVVLEPEVKLIGFAQNPLTMR